MKRVSENEGFKLSLNVIIYDITNKSVHVWFRRVCGTKSEFTSKNLNILKFKSDFTDDWIILDSKKYCCSGLQQFAIFSEYSEYEIWENKSMLCELCAEEYEFSCQDSWAFE